MPYKQSDGSTKNGPAQYNSWMQLTQAQLDAITAVEGAETGDPGRLERFAQLVHVVNSTSSEGGGGGPIQDGVTDTILATVGNLTNANPLAAMIVDANGDQITSFGATLIAESNTPVAVADGAPVDLWVDEYGRQVLYGANFSLNALDVNLINDSTLSRLGPVVNINATVVDIVGDVIDVGLYHNITIHTVSESVTVGGTITVQHSLDAVNWVDEDVNVILGNGVTTLKFIGAYKYIRTVLSGRVDGTYTTTVYAGN